jgi:hypothetical protein
VSVLKPLRRGSVTGRPCGKFTSVPWAIAGGPLDHAEPGYDGRGWLWELRRGEEYRRVFVQISGTALAVSSGLASETRLAIATRGASEVEKVLAADEPPRMVSCTTAGCAAVDMA